MCLFGTLIILSCVDEKCHLPYQEAKVAADLKASPCLVGLSRRLGGKESTCQCSRHKRCRFNPWVGKIPWRRKWQPTPVFLPGEFHGQRNLVGYSAWGRQE